MFLCSEKEEKRLRKESSLIRKLEKQKLKKEHEQEVQQEEKESTGKTTTLSLFMMLMNRYEHMPSHMNNL